MIRSLAPLTLLALAACAEPAPPPAQPAEPPAVIDAQLRAMEKAKAVEPRLLESQRKVDEAMAEDEAQD